MTVEKKSTNHISHNPEDPGHWTPEAIEARLKHGEQQFGRKDEGLLIRSGWLSEIGQVPTQRVRRAKHRKQLADLQQKTLRATNPEDDQPIGLLEAEKFRLQAEKDRLQKENLQQFEDDILTRAIETGIYFHARSIPNQEEEHEQNTLILQHMRSIAIAYGVDVPDYATGILSPQERHKLLEQAMGHEQVQEEPHESIRAGNGEEQPNPTLERLQRYVSDTYEVSAQQSLPIEEAGDSQIPTDNLTQAFSHLLRNVAISPKETAEITETLVRNLETASGEQIILSPHTLAPLQQHPPSEDAWRESMEL